MKKLILIVACIAAGSAFAGESGEVVVRSLAVKERLQTIELINVTAEKSPTSDAEPISTLLEGILEEAEDLEPLEDSAQQ
ncbi:MAG: hypothetical protein QF921_00510 [Pseudomonadales bacterium]|jgi:cytochrome c556|nr:hypothetical protein [Pseudomonadales bacterium]MDP6472086.1 hypothetical protein [Pseudomonadales bacterium]MDP6826641.1 hypothetical protein [Pseudomonadales bacterium]MDP6969998.1 hypothetical protein [Pseudomonadales bacterium]|tara:strand:+ start:1176 stop:1415 length:240 start_codon:yes stop_codon:yes gene_type:complete